MCRDFFRRNYKENPDNGQHQAKIIHKADCQVGKQHEEGVQDQNPKFKVKNQERNPT